MHDCIGGSARDPPLSDAIKLLVLGTGAKPTPLDPKIFHESLLLLAEKSILQAGERASRTLEVRGHTEGLESTRSGADAAEALCDPLCPWVSSALSAHRTEGGPSWCADTPSKIMLYIA